MNKKMFCEEFIISSVQKGIPKEWKPITDGTREWWRDFRRWLKEPRMPGVASLEPSIVKAGEKSQLVFIFKIGKGGIGRYGHIAIECPFDKAHQPVGYQLGMIPGSQRPVITIRASRKNVIFKMTMSDGILDVMVLEGELRQGDEVYIVIGDKIGSHAIMPEQAQSYPLIVSVDQKGDGKFGLIQGWPVLKVVGSCAEAIDVIVPVLQQTGQKFKLIVIALDKYRNPDPNYEGAIRLTCTDRKALFSEIYTFKKKDKGIHIFKNIELHSNGTFTFTVADDENGLIGKSNPITTDFRLNEYKIYVGDIHVHTIRCDGFGTTDENYLWARDVRKLDFSAMSNHVEGAKRYDVKDFWPEVQEAAKHFNKHGKFVTFLGFEWGSWERFGDKCVYYLDDNQPWFAANEESSNTPEKLWQCLKGKKVLTIPHHPKYGGPTDWSFYNNEYQRLVEIYSICGNSECGGNHSVQHALMNGHKLGVIAGGDAHYDPPGNAGLTMVYAKRLDRKSIFEALKDRHCYATTGKRIFLYFAVNGHIMGSEIVLTKSSLRHNERKIEIQVAGTGKIEKIAIVRNNVDIYINEPSAYKTKFKFVDKDDFEAAADDIPNFAGATIFYYVRVVQEDGACAWSSPVWITLAE